ncbi:hypothetical protein DCS_00447 [Drechmeria coniospora]|uniref:SUN domain-containing protein n=1 Tax=Drechmeria coniospora TaxID=98403 RepID=A0A151GQC9_DRECN|nr:hypothetical protein DCS_00447 [Drechmeria coniospora]KYK59317.1 hypothetical protein DCS_00447 [Drechmeria coniospora]
MKISSLQALAGPTAIILSAAGCDASSGHQRLHQLERRLDAQHAHGHARAHVRSEGGLVVEKRGGGTCAFPTNDRNLHAVTTDAMNAGWAMSPDQPCKPGSYCPYACQSGMVMAQWQPGSVYQPGSSMNGGLFCDESGVIHKPFDDKENCVQGTGAVVAVNDANRVLSWCQTVLPGNEAMLIPTEIKAKSTKVVAVPDHTYWQGTAAHYYINPPGVGTEGCIWGDESKPVGNWSPYVAGANTVANGQTFVKIGWNPIWMNTLALKSQGAGFSLKIECPDGGCSGLPCEIDGSNTGVVKANTAPVGAGGSAFCVVTVDKGKTANIVAYDGSGGSVNYGQVGDDSASSKPVDSSPAPVPTTSMQPTTTSTTSTPTSTPTPTPTTTSSSSSTTTYVAPTTHTTALMNSTTILLSTGSPKKNTTRPSVMPGIFHEDSSNSTHDHMPSASGPSSLAPTATGSSNYAIVSNMQGGAGRQHGSVTLAGLLALFVATAVLL